MRHSGTCALLAIALLTSPAFAQTPNTTTNPLKVQLIAPTGRAPQVQQVTIVFDQAMVPLGAMERTAEQVPVRLSCQQKGDWRWIEPATLAYLYDEPVPPSTSCTVDVTTDARSASGAQLAEPVSATFETARLDAVRSVPASGSSDLELQPEITWILNQPAQVESMGKVAKFVYKSKGKTPTEIPAMARALPKPIDPYVPAVDVARAYVFRPVRPLPRETEFQLVLEPGVMPMQGTLPSDQRIAMTYKTYPFLKVESVSCSQECRPDCDPSSGITIQLSTAVEEKKAKEFVKIEPPQPQAATEEGGVEPSTSEGSTEAAEENFVQWLHIPGPFEPGKDYTLTILPDLEDQFGQRLGTQETHSFHFGILWPALDLTGPFAVYESGGEHKYPLGVRNVTDASLRYRFFKKDEIVPFFKGNGLLRTYDHPDLLAGVEAVQVQKPSLPERPNRFYFWPLDLDQLFGANLTSGLAYLEVTSPTIEQRYNCNPEEKFRVPLALQVSDLGLTAKVGYFKSLVWVTSLSKGQPIADVAIEIRDENNKVLFQGKTDQEGILLAPGRKGLGVGDEGGWREFPLLWVFAEHGSETAFIHSAWSEGIEAWNFGIDQDDLKTSSNLRVYAFSDRPIYRPGDSVRWKMIARSLLDDRLAQPEKRSQPYTVILRDSQGEIVQTQSATLNGYGSAMGEVKLSRKAKLGYYSIEAGFDADHMSGVGSFQVEEYRAPNFKVEARAQKPSAFPGDQVPFNLEARYHFGAAVGGQKINYNVSRTASAFSPKSLEGYESRLTFKVGEEWPDEGVKSLSSGQETLTQDGKASVTATAPNEELAGPIQLEVEASVQDQDSRLVAGRGSVLVHPAALYVGLRAKGWGVGTGESMGVDVLVTDPEGKVQSGVPVALKLYRRVYNTVRRKGVGSFYHYENTIQDTEAGTASVQSSVANETASFRVDASGEYFIVAEVTDANGHKARSSTSFYVWGGSLAGWARYDHDRIDIVPDRAEYAIGETAHILVKSPYESAKALITVERDSVLRQWQAEIQGSATLVDVPIQAGDAPNVFVSVLLVQGRVTEKFTEEGVDLGKPSFKIGYAQLLVRDATRKLDVTVRAEKTTYRPRDKVRVDIEVKDSSGAGTQAELCVIAVDEAVLQLSANLRYDPYEYFYSPRSLGVRSVDTRIHLIGRRHFGSKGENPGGGGGPDSARKNFQTVAAWEAQIETDASGKAVVEFDLPDNLTSFRIIAVASDKTDRFGRGWNSITVTQPLVSQPALPRFLAAGDHAEVGILLNNGTGAAGDGTVTLAGDGFLPAEPAPQKLNLGVGQTSEVRFPIEAASTAQELVLRFTSALGSFSDALETRIPVRDLTPLDTYASYGSVTEEGATSTELLVPEGSRTDRGGLTVTISSTLASALDGAVDWLQAYPYTCLEQQTSKAIMYGVRLSLSDRLRSAKVTSQSASSGLEDYLANLASYQSWEGGFDYWPPSGGDVHQDPYLTAYVLTALHYLDAMGQHADAAVTDRALEYLDNVVRHNRWPWYYSDEAKREARAAAVSALARWSRLEEAVLQPVIAERKKLSLFGLACLLDAQLQLGGQSKNFQATKTELMTRAVVTAAETSFQEVDDDGLETVLSSSVRSNARVLLVLAAAEPGGELGAKVMRWLMTSQKAGRWENTHDNAYCLLAAHEYLKAWEGKAPNFQASAKLGGSGDGWAASAAKSIGNWTFSSPTAAPGVVDVPVNELRPGQKLVLSLEKQGAGRMYYGLRLQVAKESPSKEAVNAGFTVLRQYLPVGASETAGTPQFVRGKLVKVRLTIHAPALRHFVAVEDPLPAGLEAVNLSLATESQSEAAAASNGEGADEQSWDRWYQYVEKRDDRVVLYSTYLPAGTYTYEYLARATTLGTFAAGATHVEEMYTPEVYGRGIPAEVKVEAEK